MQRIEQLGGIFGGARSIVGLAAVSLILAACSTAGSTSASATASASASASASSAAASASASASTPASGGAATAINVADSSLGQILTDQDGRTIYRFTPDSANTSTCSGGCADNWPAVTAASAPTAGSGVTGQVATMTRDDGSTQVTVNGFPVYYFAGDTAAGQVNGQGVGGKWFVITAAGEMHQ
jgi:predicted lipoprotein with Yx(FWY)xxD motif